MPIANDAIPATIASKRMMDAAGVRYYRDTYTGRMKVKNVTARTSYLLDSLLKETEGITMGVNHSSQRVIPNALATAFFMNALMVIPSFWAAIATPL